MTLTELQEANADKVQTCINRGIHLDPIVQLKIRLDTLTAFVIDDGLTDEFEHVYESLLSQYLDAVIGQSNTPSLIVP